MSEIKINQEQQDKYLELNGAYCPVCGSDDIIADHIDAHGGVAWSNVYCEKCGSSWVDRWVLHSFSDLELGDDVSKEDLAKIEQWNIVKA